MGKPEGAVENYLIKQADVHDSLFYKFSAWGKTGVPDRIIIGHGRTVFVELKAPGEEPRRLQKEVIKEMREHGAIVCVIDTKAGIDDFFRHLENHTIDTYEGTITL